MSACMPNSLWHIDGYHKLIRWRIVIHGVIDGYILGYTRVSSSCYEQPIRYCAALLPQCHKRWSTFKGEVRSRR